MVPEWFPAVPGGPARFPPPRWPGGMRGSNAFFLPAFGRIPIKLTPPQVGVISKNTPKKFRAFGAITGTNKYYNFAVLLLLLQPALISIKNFRASSERAFYNFTDYELT